MNNRFLTIHHYLDNPESKFSKRRLRRNISQAKFSCTPAKKCPKVSEAPMGSDDFIVDVLHFFFNERLHVNQLNNGLRKVAAEAVWKATEGSKAMDLVPRPPGSKAGVAWLVGQAVQIGFRKAQNKCIYEIVRVGVASGLKHDYDLAKMGQGFSHFRSAPFDGGLTTSTEGIDFIKKHEAFRADMYNDPVGHCTIGYGHLLHKGKCNGSEDEEFKAGITEARATELLKGHLKNIENVIRDVVKVSLNQHQFDALVSFTYNVGTGAFKGSTLLKKLNEGKYNEVPAQLARWVFASGKRLKGLEKRREAEGKIFSSGIYAISHGYFANYFEENETPRGLRNNNPGNIRISKTDWEGKVPNEENTDGGFEQFTTKAYGIRALILLLRTYYTKYNLKTIKGIISRFAPSNENHTENYINFVSEKTGYGNSEELTWSKEMIRKLVKAICHFENGKACVTDEEFETAWNLVPENRRTVTTGQSYTGFESSQFSANERVLIVLLENGGIDLKVQPVVEMCIDMVPGSSYLINDSTKKQIANYVNQKIIDATDSLLESAELLLNRFNTAVPKYYGKVIILRDSTASYNDLKNALIQQTENNNIIDLFILTHGSGDYISVKGGINSKKINAIKMANGNKPIRLRAVYMMNCVGSSLNQAWLDIGAKVVSGTKKNNYLPEPTVFFMWRNWKNGQTFQDAVTNAYSSTIIFIETMIKTIPVIGTGLALLTNIRSRQFIKDSAPVIQGSGSLRITSDSISYAQTSAREMAITMVPIEELV
jgi:GH24 family phage-related lysozyme (muramidase)